LEFKWERGVSELLPVLAVVLVGGRIASGVSLRLGLPGVFGELVLGLAIGPVIVHWLNGGATVETFGEIGVLVLMLLVGLETDISVIKSVGKAAFLVAFAGAILPTFAGAAVASWFGESMRVSLFIGVALSATSVSITAATLRELGRLNTTAGRTILVAAVIDDVIGLLLISMVAREGGDSPAIAGLRVVAFLAVAAAGGALLGPLLSVLERHVEEFLAVAVGLGLLYAWMAEEIGGLAGITGAYLAGLLLARAMPHKPLARGVEALASGFFATLFFVSLGLHVRLEAVSPVWVLALGAVALVTKFVVCGLGAWVGGLDKIDSLAIGVGMIPRGEVALIVASIGLNRGVLADGLFSMLVVVVILTTVVTPVLLKLVFALTEGSVPRALPLASGYASKGSD
jgi:Kef-type K+ transport system membrane component KefB